VQVAMEFTIADQRLKRIASDTGFSGDYPQQVASMFRQTLQIVAAAPDESDLAHFKCLGYRTVPGRGSRRRLALTKTADLVVSIRNGRKKSRMIVEQITLQGRKSQ
jgi:hypothetical protein